MTTKPPSGTGLATAAPDHEVSGGANGEPTLGEPTLGEPTLGEPTLGEPTLGEPTLGAANPDDDAIGDILLDASETPPGGSPLTLPAPKALSLPASVETPIPLSLETPAPLSLETPGLTPIPLSGKGKGLASNLAGPPPPKAPAPLPSRDPASALPSIPSPKKEPSGAFPLPGMAPVETNKSSDDDKTLIARLSLIDELVEESTKVEPIETALRAAATKEAPLALSDQATAQREKALGVSAMDRISAAEFADPGDSDEMVVSATPGIISISDEDEDDDETTASQRPPSARKTPTPATGGPSLKTPVPLTLGVPRLPPPGRGLHLPTPPAGMPPVPMPIVSPASAPQRALTPALPIPAPMGTHAARGSPASAIFNKVHLPVGGLVAFLVAAFGGGFILGAWLWGGQPPAPVAVVAQPSAPAAAPPAPAAEPAAAKAEPTPAPPSQPPAAPAPTASAEPQPAPAPAVAPEPTPPPEPVHHVATARPKAVHKPVAATAPATSPPAAKVAAKPAPAKPAAPKPATLAKVAAKPAAAKGDRAKGKNWVDPFAE